MEVLCGRRRLADLQIVSRCQLQKTFDPRARVLRALAFVSVRKQQHYPRKQSPLVFTRAYELIDDGLRHVHEVAKLRFPEHERLRIVAAVTILKSQHASFGG